MICRISCCKIKSRKQSPAANIALKNEPNKQKREKSRCLMSNLHVKLLKEAHLFYERGTPIYKKRYTYSSDKAYLFVRHPFLHLGMLPSVQVVVRCHDKFIVQLLRCLLLFLRGTMWSKAISFSCFPGHRILGDYGRRW